MGMLRPGKGSRGPVFGLAAIIVLALLVAAGFAARARAARRLRAELAAARREIDSGLFALASRRLNGLAAEWPGEAEVVYHLGRCASGRGDAAAALGFWSRITPDARWGAAAALAFAREAIPQGRLAAAERTLREVVGRGGGGDDAGADAERSEIRRMLETLLAQQGRLGEARDVIESLWRADETVHEENWADCLSMLREHMGLDLEILPVEWNLEWLAAGEAKAGEDDRRILALARAHAATGAGDFDRAWVELKWCRERWPDDPIVWKAWLDTAVAAGRPDLASQALGYVPASSVDEGETLALRAWFAGHRGDLPAEREALERLTAVDPGETAALTRLAEIVQQAGKGDAAATLRNRKAEVDAARDRYLTLYREGNLADHLEELARIAERLGRTFEARGFWKLLSVRQPRNADCLAALARLRPRPGAEAGDPARRLADVLGMELAGAKSAKLDEDGDRDGDGGCSVQIPRFADGSTSSRLADFIHDNGVTPIHQLPESFSGGVGLIDYDGDGFLDVYCVQGGRFPPVEGARSADRLYRNRGDGTFEDRTRETRIAEMPGGYGHGVAVADYDNDGRPDLFVTRWRSYALYHNRGDGTFEDRTAQAGLGGDRDWPTSAAFADFDNDGDLDLYVCHYGKWDAANPRLCKDPSGTINFACDPRVIESLPDHVFRNDQGRFVDVTAQSGIVDREGRGLGVVTADLDGDGRIDVFVANDSTANFLFRNLGDFRFEEVGHAAGVAANAQGGYQAGMGVACGDLDGDGRLDLAVTNYYGESTTFFHNLGGGLFADHTASAGLAAPSRRRLGFGAGCLDANNDGRVDLMTVNGHVSDGRPLFPYAMTPQLFLGCPAGKIKDATALAGDPFQQLHVGRGLAVGDLENDGTIDAVMLAQNEPAMYFRNIPADKEKRNHFVRFRLAGSGSRSNRDGIGAEVTLRAGGRIQVAQRYGGGSFQSAGDPRLHFGLGKHIMVDLVEVRWPSGRTDQFRNLEADREYLLREGNVSPRRPP